MAVFTREDRGCFVDGALGGDHVADKVASMIEPWNPTLADELRAASDPEHPDNEWIGELLDDATSILNEHVEDGIAFVWEAGDLILTDDLDSF